MFIFVIGHSKSGKSRYAEQLSARICNGGMLYIATMIPVGEGEEGAACIARHRAQREGLGFVTIEQPRHIHAVKTEKNDTILLEDVSNLLANTLFDSSDTGDIDAVYNEIMKLSESCENLIAVSFYGLKEDESYDEPTNNYIRKLEQLNDMLYDKAERVVMLRSGVPHPDKGELP